MLNAVLDAKGDDALKGKSIEQLIAERWPGQPLAALAWMHKEYFGSLKPAGLRGIKMVLMCAMWKRGLPEFPVLVHFVQMHGRGHS